MRSVLRRSFLKRTLGVLAAATFVLRKSYRVFAQSTQQYPERLLRLMRESPGLCGNPEGHAQES